MFDNQLDKGNGNVIDLADDAGIGVVTVANDDDEQVPEGVITLPQYIQIKFHDLTRNLQVLFERTDQVYRMQVSLERQLERLHEKVDGLSGKQSSSNVVGGTSAVSVAGQSAVAGPVPKLPLRATSSSCGTPCPHCRAPKFKVTISTTIASRSNTRSYCCTIRLGVHQWWTRWRIRSCTHG